MHGAETSGVIHPVRQRHCNVRRPYRSEHLRNRRLEVRSVSSCFRVLRCRAEQNWVQPTCAVYTAIHSTATGPSGFVAHKLAHTLQTAAYLRRTVDVTVGITLI